MWVQGNAEAAAALSSPPSPDLPDSSACPDIPESSAAPDAAPVNDVDGVFRPGWEVSCFDCRYCSCLHGASFALADGAEGCSCRKDLDAEIHSAVAAACRCNHGDVEQTAC